MTTTFDFDYDLFSDFHKDTYGFRPRAGHEFYDEATTDARRQEIWDETFVELGRANEREKEEQAAADGRFENMIKGAMNLGARDVKTAIRWILDAEKIDADNCMYGADYVAYHFGLSYQNRWRGVIGEVADQICKEDRENGSVAAD